MTSTEIAVRISELVDGERTEDVFDALVSLIASGIEMNYGDRQAALDDVIAALRAELLLPDPHESDRHVS